MVAVDRALRRECAELVSGLAIPTPFDEAGFVAALTEQRGRPVHVVAAERFDGVQLDGAGACGVLVSTDEADYVFAPSGTTPLHRRHILLHEVGHLLGAGSGPPAAQGFDAEVAARLLPSLPPGLVRRVLGRSGYSAVEERRAELIATLIAVRIAATERCGLAEAAPESRGARRMRAIFGPGER